MHNSNNSGKESSLVNILYERTQRIAKPIQEKIIAENLSYIKFTLKNAGFYGIPYEFAKEVLLETHITKLPSAPPFVAGIINQRGALISIIDLRSYFHLPFEECKEQQVIVIDDGGFTVGIIADKIEGSDCYDSNALIEPISSQESYIKTEFLLGLHKGSIAILNIPNLMLDIKNNCQDSK